MVTRRDVLGVAVGVTGTAIGSGPVAALAGAGEQIAQASGETYRVYEVGDQKGPETLRFVDRPVPQPGRGQALIKVTATSINARDHGLI